MVTPNYVLKLIRLLYLGYLKAFHAVNGSLSSNPSDQILSGSEKITDLLLWGGEGGERERRTF